MIIYVVKCMSRYTSIPVSVELKKLLEREKGDMSWDDFLFMLLRIKKRIEAEEAIKRIKARLMKSEHAIKLSEDELRRGLKFRR